MIIMIKSRRVRMGTECSTNGGEEERVEVVGRKAKEKETTRKTKKEADG
jgi:hypothetical protein